MIISHRHKFVLLCTWKAASQTMRFRLRNYNESPYPRLYGFNPYLNRVLHHTHATCAEFRCLPESNLGYFTAAFVRNPYDRVYSGFRQLQFDARAVPKLRQSKPWIGDLLARQVSEMLAQLEEAQFDLDVWLALIGDEQVLEIGRSTSFLLHPACYWTHVAGLEAVDFIGRVEQFESDFARFADQVGIELSRPHNVNVADLQGDSSTNPQGYRYVSRMNARSRARVNDLFSEDFELFGYEKVT